MTHVQSEKSKKMRASYVVASSDCSWPGVLGVHTSISSAMRHVESLIADRSRWYLVEHDRRELDDVYAKTHDPLLRVREVKLTLDMTKSSPVPKNATVEMVVLRVWLHTKKRSCLLRQKVSEEKRMPSDRSLVDLLRGMAEHPGNLKDDAMRDAADTIERLTFERNNDQKLMGVQAEYIRLAQAEQARAEWGLKQCHLLARRALAAHDEAGVCKQLPHIIRICEQQGVVSDGILREAEENHE